MLQYPLFLKKKNIIVSFVLLLTLILFIIPHTTIINRPLYGLHDLVNGEHLTIVHIWQTEGIAFHHFVPAFSFEPHDTLSRNYGLEGTNGRIYYASYPPLSFWLDYSIASLPGVQLSEGVARIASLVAFISALISLFYYLLKKHSFPAAIIGGGFFSLVPTSMYFFGGITAPEITRFAFWIPAFVFLTLWYKKLTINHLFVYGLFIFLLSLTDWLGFILSGCIVLYCLLRCMFFWKDKTAVIREALVGGFTVLSSLSALVTTVTIYSSISSIHSVIDVWFAKGTYRGNWPLLLRSLSTEVYGTPSTSGGLYIWFDRIIHGYLYKEFGPTFWFIIVGMLLILSASIIYKRSHKRLDSTSKKTASNDFFLILFFFFIPPVMLAVFLPQAHYIHDFYWLSFLPFFCLVAALLFHMIMKSVIDPLKHSKALSVSISILLIAILYLQSLPMFHTMRDNYVGDETTLKTFKLMAEVRTKTNPKDLILLPFAYQPNMWFYLRRNAIQFVTIPGHVAFYQPQFKYFPNVYYVGDDRQMVDTICSAEKSTQVGSGWMCKLQ